MAEHEARERDAEFGGVMCGDCGWKLGGRDAHPDADRQHREHTADDEFGAMHKGGLSDG